MRVVELKNLSWTGTQRWEEIQSGTRTESYWTRTLWLSDFTVKSGKSRRSIHSPVNTPYSWSWTGRQDERGRRLTLNLPCRSVSPFHFLPLLRRFHVFDPSPRKLGFTASLLPLSPSVSQFHFIHRNEPDESSPWTQSLLNLYNYLKVKLLH